MQIQQCCTSDLCNMPIPTSAHPRNNPMATPSFAPSVSTPPVSSLSPPAPSFGPPDIVPDLNPDTGTPHFPLCNCDSCLGSTCRGLLCGTKVAYSDLPLPVFTLMCVNDTRVCMETFDPNPSAGTVTVICCDSDLCNSVLPLPSLPPPTPATTRTSPPDSNTGKPQAINKYPVPTQIYVPS